MPDLNSPLKSPFIFLYNVRGEKIADNWGEDNDLSIVSMKYKYDDEDDDICSIKLQMSNPRSLGRLGISRGTELRVKWGYIDNDKTSTVTVLVRDLTSKYGSNVIYTQLECTDYLTYLKIFRSPDTGYGSILDYIQSQIDKKYNIQIYDKGEIIYNQVTDDFKDEAIDQLTDPNDPIRKDPKLWDNYSWTVGETNIIRQYIEQEREILSSNRSIYITLADLFNKAPRGPWFITGRGYTLLIHNRNVTGNIFRSYQYKQEPGQLIDFQAKTKFETFERQSISYSGMDAKDRKNYYLEDYRKALMTQRTPKEILEDKTITEQQAVKELKEFWQFYSVGYANFGATRTEGAFIDPGKDSQLFLPGTFKDSYITKYGYTPSVQDHTKMDRSKLAPGVSSEEQFNPDINDRILRAVWYTFPLETFEDAVNTTNNRQRELAMEKEEGNAIVEGDPYLRDQQKIYISNVDDQHEGIYYIKKCEHTVSQQGYKTKMECFKVIEETKNRNISQVTQKRYEQGELDAEDIKYFERESLLFGTDFVVRARVYQGDRQYQAAPSVALPGPRHEVYKTEELRSSDLFDSSGKWTVDSWANEMVRLSRNPDAEIEIISMKASDK